MPIIIIAAKIIKSTEISFNFIEFILPLSLNQNTIFSLKVKTLFCLIIDFVLSNLTIRNRGRKRKIKGICNNEKVFISPLFSVPQKTACDVVISSETLPFTNSKVINFTSY